MSSASGERDGAETVITTSVVGWAASMIVYVSPAPALGDAASSRPTA